MKGENVYELRNGGKEREGEGRGVRRAEEEE